MSLCLKCQKYLKLPSELDVDICDVLVNMPMIHCHHNKEKKKTSCWCERYHYETDFANNLQVGVHPIKYCIECGKKL